MTGSPIRHALSILLTLSMLVLILAVTTSASRLDSGKSFGITSEVTLLNGSTDYEIDANAFDPSAPDSVSRIQSQLEFPLDLTLASATVTYCFGGEVRVWFTRVVFKASVSDPSKLMTDEDWIDDFPVSFTESDASASLLMLSWQLSRRIITRDNYMVHLFGGLDYQRIEQNIVGFDGWQDLDRNGVRSPLRGNDSVIAYEVTYLSPEVGVRTDIDFSNSFGGSFSLTSGLLFASDSDDHLLRGIKSEGDGIGVALGASGELRFHPKVSKDHSLWFGLFGGVQYHHAEGDVTKTWYRDEGTITAGTVDADIPYTIKSMLTSIGFRFGLEF